MVVFAKKKETIVATLDASNNATRRAVEMERQRVSGMVVRHGRYTSRLRKKPARTETETTKHLGRACQCHRTTNGLKKQEGVLLFGEDIWVSTITTMTLMPVLRYPRQMIHLLLFLLVFAVLYLLLRLYPNFMKEMCLRAVATWTSRTNRILASLDALGRRIDGFATAHACPFR